MTIIEDEDKKDEDKKDEDKKDDDKKDEKLVRVQQQLLLGCKEQN